jgi:hypothetical protein
MIDNTQKAELKKNLISMSNMRAWIQNTESIWSDMGGLPNQTKPLHTVNPIYISSICIYKMTTVKNGHNSEANTRKKFTLLKQPSLYLYSKKNMASIFLWMN